MKRKFLGIFMAFLLLGIFYPVAVSAAQNGTCGANGDNLTWVLDDNGKLTISGTGRMQDYPYGGEPDKGPWLLCDEEIKNVVIEEGVENVGLRAFYQCETLETVELPSTLTEIGGAAFFYCGDSFTSITIPAGVNSIEQSALSGNENLAVKGYSGSYAESFAEKAGINFISLGDMPAQEIRVSTSAELLDAIGSGRKIILEDGVYTIDEALEIGRFDAGIRGLTITAENPGKAEILSKDGYAPVVKIMYSESIELDGIILGHESISYEDGCGSGETSSGYVLQASNSDNVTVKNCDLYGCGTVALVLSYTDNFTAENCVMRDCKEYIASLIGENINIKNCVISGNAYDQEYVERYPGIWTADYPVNFNGCMFLNNRSTEFSNSIEKVITENCTFHNNVWDEAEPEEYGICLNGITWQIQGGVLKLGYPIEMDDGTSITSELGEVLPYSSYSLPWRGKTYDSVDTAEGVVYDGTPHGSCGADAEWILEDGVLTISGTGAADELGSVSEYKERITSVVIKEGIMSFGNLAFMNYTALKSVSLPDSLESIAANSFTGCASLSEVTFGSGLKSIGTAAFSGCALTNVALPDSVETIETQAFGNIKTLAGITLSGSLRELAADTFRDSINLKTIDIPEENEAFALNGGVLYTKDMKTVVACPAGMDTASYTIPEGVTKIGAYAFYKSSIGEIVIPESVAELEEASLAWLRGNRLVIPESVAVIGIDAVRMENRDSKLYVYAGSAAEEYCQNGNIAYICIPEIEAVETWTANGKTYVQFDTQYIEGISLIAVGSSGGAVLDIKSADYGFAELEGEADTVKVFCWESFESMYPLDKAHIVTVE